MKTLTYTESRQMTGRELFSIHPLRPTRLVRRFKRFIEKSNWDERIIRIEPLFDTVCMVAVILSGLVLSPIILAAFLK
jgi:hypothetical protein